VLSIKIKITQNAVLMNATEPTDNQLHILMHKAAVEAKKSFNCQTGFG
jgi:hypothetical protein